VVAAGPWTGDVLPGWRERVRPSRQIALDLAVPETLRSAWTAMPMVLDGIAWQGSGFYAVPPVAGLDLKVGDHSFSMQGHPSHDRRPSPAERAAILALARAGLRHKNAYAEKDARSCFYSVAEEERFIAERLGPTLVLAGFSGHGFKFGPLVGLAAVQQLADEIGAADLARWLAGHDVAVPAALARDALVTSGTVLG
jgi:glycine/D-amino acid oxidase-like deaminating enzyme